MCVCVTDYLSDIMRMIFVWWDNFTIIQDDHTVPLVGTVGDSWGQLGTLHSALCRRWRPASSFISWIQLHRPPRDMPCFRPWPLCCTKVGMVRFSGSWKRLQHHPKLQTVWKWWTSLPIFNLLGWFITGWWMFVVWDPRSLSLLPWVTWICHSKDVDGIGNINEYKMCIDVCIVCIEQDWFLQ